MLIQKCVRGYLQRKKFKGYQKRRVDAVVLIQVKWRGFRWKRLVPKIINNNKVGRPLL